MIVGTNFLDIDLICKYKYKADHSKWKLELWILKNHLVGLDQLKKRKIARILTEESFKRV